jgi:hypothetical protein
VELLNEKQPVSSPPPTSYGNMPLDVSQGGSSSAQPNDPKSDRFQQGSKKFGKKLGNAGMRHSRSLVFGGLRLTAILAIFGAGATVGSQIVNSIF